MTISDDVAKRVFRAYVDGGGSAEAPGERLVKLIKDSLDKSIARTINESVHLLYEHQMLRTDMAIVTVIQILREHMQVA